MEKEKTITKKKPQPIKYRVEIDILGNIYEGQGKTFEEACQDLDLTWKDIKGRGKIAVYKGDKKYERWFVRPQLVRLVSNPITQHIWARQFEFFLK